MKRVHNGERLSPSERCRTFIRLRERERERCVEGHWLGRGYDVVWESGQKRGAFGGCYRDIFASAGERTPQLELSRLYLLTFVLFRTYHILYRGDDEDLKSQLYHGPLKSQDIV
jgi:hypothetical protein